VRQTLEGLPAGERAALVLRDLEGHATEEVARMLGVKAGTVRCQVAMARRKLLASLGGGKS
jgi:RNA polymerase sigma-70 factor, ECF subfamily